MPSWLAGGWTTESADGSWVEEWWTPPKAGLMIGAGRSGKAGKLDWWEHTRIELADGKLRFCALPKGQAGACFPATRVAASEIVFENPAHDFPNRIAYRREGKALFAEVSGKDGANVQRWRFRLVD
ncbi:DUF6265 family protein [Sphingomonas lutea]|nr:DUF6265 family protein [Sphingomonas lutea]